MKFPFRIPYPWTQVSNNAQNLLPTQYAGPPAAVNMWPSAKSQLARNGLHAPLSNYNIPTLVHWNQTTVPGSGAGPGGNEINTWLNPVTMRQQMREVGQIARCTPPDAP